MSKLQNISLPSVPETFYFWQSDDSDDMRLDAENTAAGQYTDLSTS